ncbi:MAG: hypothetical protein WC773_00950 [Patescibacteria group bacterium]|jgi:hypothetical protein
MTHVTDIDEAIEILSGEMVVTAQQARQALGEEDFGRSIDLLLFSADTLRQCAGQNQQNEADWRLMFDPGISLAAMRQLFGTNGAKREPHFYRNRWWLKPGNEWACSSRSPRYHLLNFARNHTRNRWGDQPERCAKGVVRANEAVVTAVCFANCIVHNDERLLGEWYHWGWHGVSKDKHVAVGGFDRYGFYVWFNADTNPTFDVGMVEELAQDQ